MSYSALYSVYRTTVRERTQYRNGWGTAAVLWNAIAKMYYNGRSWIHDEKWLWGVHRDMHVPLAIRRVHCFTYDRAVCSRESIAELSLACAEAGRLVNAVSDAGWINHWPTIALDLIRLPLDVRALGFALMCTSVSNNWAGYKGGGSIFDPLVEVYA